MKNTLLGAREVPQWVNTLATKSAQWSSMPRTHMVERTGVIARAPTEAHNHCKNYTIFRHRPALPPHFFHLSHQFKSLCFPTQNLGVSLKQILTFLICTQLTKSCHNFLPLSSSPLRPSSLKQTCKFQGLQVFLQTDSSVSIILPKGKAAVFSLLLANLSPLESYYSQMSQAPPLRLAL